MSEGFGTFSSQEGTMKRNVPDRVLVSRLYKYVKPYRRNFIIGIPAIVIATLAGLLSPYMHMIAVDAISATPINYSLFMWWVPIFVVVQLSFWVASYVQIYQIRMAGEKTVESMRDDMMRKIQVISLRYFSEGQAGRIMSRPTNDAQACRMFLRMGLTTIIMDSVMIVGALFIVFFLNVELALITVGVIPLAVLVDWYLGRFSRRASRIALTSLSAYTGKMQENLSGMKVIKSFVREDETGKEVKEYTERTRKAYTTTIKISSSFMPIGQYVRIIGTALLLYFGAQLVINGSIPLGMLLAFIEYQWSFFRPLTEFMTAYDQYQMCMAALERMFDLMDTEVEVKDPLADRAVEIKTIDDVKFENVTFGYDRKVPVIEDISFDLKGSKKLAFVGPTGAGKSTIINLLARFYDPLSGRIIINGHDVKDITIASLRSQMSIVLQDSFLFAMSVRDNIRFGKPEASDEEVVEAAKIVGAHEFIMKLPGGYDYVIKESSSNISIGQRQLISFARTLLMNPKLLILDEATSSIDPYTELVIQNALKKLLENRLAIIIAHRLSTIRLSDEIVVVDQGKIVERGSHSELMNNGGLYSSFYKMQFREEVGLTTDVTKPSS
jgi:ATP-binding cassette subfamily B protein